MARVGSHCRRHSVSRRVSERRAKNICLENPVLSAQCNRPHTANTPFSLSSASQLENKSDGDGRRIKKKRPRSFSLEGSFPRLFNDYDEHGVAPTAGVVHARGARGPQLPPSFHESVDLPRSSHLMIRDGHRECATRDYNFIDTQERAHIFHFSGQRDCVRPHLAPEVFNARHCKIPACLLDVRVEISRPRMRTRGLGTDQAGDCRRV